MLSLQSDTDSAQVSYQSYISINPTVIKESTREILNKTEIKTYRLPNKLLAKPKLTMSALNAIPDRKETTINHSMLELTREEKKIQKPSPKIDDLDRNQNKQQTATIPLQNYQYSSMIISNRVI